MNIHHPGATTSLSVSHDPHWCSACRLGRHTDCGPARCHIAPGQPVPCRCTHPQEVPA